MKELLDTLTKCGYEAHFVKTKKEALELSKTYIHTGMSIGLGGSTSVSQIGLLDYIIEKDDLTVHNQYEKGISMQENTKRRREGMLTDLYVTGTNALTKDGKLVNADGSGNRVAAMIFGPKKVLVIVGKNKIVETVEDGFNRVMDVAAVKNIERMNNKSIQMGKEPRHNLDNIANKFTYIKADEQDRIVLIIVDEELGF